MSFINTLNVIQICSYSNKLQFGPKWSKLKIWRKFNTEVRAYFQRLGVFQCVCKILHGFLGQSQPFSSFDSKLLDFGLCPSLLTNIFWCFFWNHDRIFYNLFVREIWYLKIGILDTDTFLLWTSLTQVIPHWVASTCCGLSLNTRESKQQCRPEDTVISVINAQKCKIAKIKIVNKNMNSNRQNSYFPFAIIKKAPFFREHYKI